MNRLNRLAVIIKPATILSFHKSLVKRKYSKLYSNKTNRKPGRKPPNPAMVKLIVEMKQRILGVPQSHPFVERVIGTIRREYLDHTLFFNKHDLENKLRNFQEYYNKIRVHSSLALKTPATMTNKRKALKEVESLSNYSWQSYCNKLYQYPVAA